MALKEPLGWTGKGVPLALWRDAEARLGIMEDWFLYALLIGARLTRRRVRQTVVLDTAAQLEALGLVAPSAGDLIKPETTVLEVEGGR